MATDGEVFKRVTESWLEFREIKVLHRRVVVGCHRVDTRVGYIFVH